jgi:HK97 family phage portal protein
MQMLHGRWLPLPGVLRGISPLEAMRLSFGSAIATQDHAARFFGQGASLAFGVEVPGTLTPEQKKDLGDSLRKRYAGLQNSHAIGVLTAGAKFITGLAPTPEQAQFLGTRHFEVEDLCRPYGVPPAMAGSTEPGAASFASTDNYDKWFKERAVQPLAEKIEDQYDRLAPVPETITVAGASAAFKFNLDAVYRVSLLARYQAYGEGVRGGFLKPNEARALEDRPPVADGGDSLYMQQQMVPISDLGATKATEPLDTQPAPAGA